MKYGRLFKNATDADAWYCGDGLGTQKGIYALTDGQIWIGDWDEAPGDVKGELSPRDLATA